MDFINLFSGALGAIIVSLLDFFFFRRQRRLEDRVDKLETDKVAKLEERVETHIAHNRRP